MLSCPRHLSLTLSSLPHAPPPPLPSLLQGTSPALRHEQKLHHPPLRTFALCLVTCCSDIPWAGVWRESGEDLFHPEPRRSHRRAALSLVFPAELRPSPTMLLSTVLCLSTLLTTVLSLPLQRRDADFLSVRRKQHKDMSGKGGDPKEKYFRTSPTPFLSCFFRPHL